MSDEHKRALIKQAHKHLDIIEKEIKHIFDTIRSKQDDE